MRAAPAPSLELARLLGPSAVTIVGASPDSFFAAALLANLTGPEHPFAGEINLVSATRTEIGGRPCYPSLDAVERPGLVYLLVAADKCLPILRSAEDRIDGVVVITSGFAADGDGSERALRDWSIERDIPLLGPNCMGLFDLGREFFGYAGPLVHVAPGRIGLVMQSGGMLSGVIGALDARGLGVGCAISYGNASRLDFRDLVCGVLEDDGIDTVLLYVESMRDVRDLRVVGAAAARLGKTVVLVQGGQSDAGSLAAQSHTGMLATSTRVVNGVARQAGIIGCRDLEAAVWSLDALARFRPADDAPAPSGADGIAIISSSGGGAVALADAADLSGIRLPQPSERTREAVAAIAGGSPASVANPYDVGASIMNRPEKLDAIVEAFSRDGAFSVLVHVAGVGLPRPQLPLHTAVAERFVRAARSRGVAVVSCAVVGAPPSESYDWDGAVFAASAREGVIKARALAARLARPVSVDESAPLAGDAGRTDGGSTPARGASRLVTGAAARDLLSALRVEWPVGAEVGGPGDIPSVAEHVGFPLVLKVEGLAHRVAVGGLLRSLRDARSLAAGVQLLRTQFGDATLTAVQQIEHSAEFIVGLVHSAEHGLLVSFGAGGSDVGGNVSFVVAPLSDSEVARVVEPYAASLGLSAAEARALRDLVSDVARLGAEHPEIDTLDLNPVGLGRNGRLYALDAKLEIEGES